MIRIYFSEETLSHFHPGSSDETGTFFKTGLDLPVLYEDEHILLVNKPAGVLSQKAAADDVSVCEWLKEYLVCSGRMDLMEWQSVNPSVCHRLDRNTSGLVICWKTLPGLREMSALIKDRSVRKLYQCFAAGKPVPDGTFRAFLSKDARTNTVRIHALPVKDAQAIETGVKTIMSGEVQGLYCSLLEVELITGKSHQIRAHLASMGHPLLGDPKYGDPGINRFVKEKMDIRFQMLHARRIEFPDLAGTFSYLSGRSFEAPLPEAFRLLKENLE